MVKLALAFPTTNIHDLELPMQPALKALAQVWQNWGQDELTITHGRDGIHSPGSLHYYGLAVDVRTWAFKEAEKQQVAAELRELLPGYDVVVEPTHLHVEAQWALDTLLRTWKQWQ